MQNRPFLLGESPNSKTIKGVSIKGGFALARDFMREEINKISLNSRARMKNPGYRRMNSSAWPIACRIAATATL